ncbi:MAG: hypothetical protein M3094_10925 [Actinomycetia bacterium]|nr:hypothetical protein [Actinomycetes bacterium]
MRLSPPTNRTFFPALALIVIGITMWFVPDVGDVSPDAAFWAVSAGGILLILGSVFKRI